MICYNLCSYYTNVCITGATGYYECSAKQSSGLDSIIVAAAAAGLKRYHVASCDYHVILIVYPIGTTRVKRSQ